MKPLRFGFLCDSVADKYSWISDQYYWPDLVCQKFGATKAYFNVDDVDTPEVYTLVDLVDNGTLEAALEENLDVIICQLLGWDMWTSNPDGAIIDSRFRRAMTMCREAGTKILFVDYYHWNLVVQNYDGWAFNNMKAIHDYLVNMDEEYSDIMGHTDLWWSHQLEYGTFVGNQDFHDENYLSDSGHIYVADRVCAALIPLLQPIWNKRFMTYACMGDSWTDVYSCVNLNDHWTRITANALGAHLVADASVAGWQVNQLYNQEVVMGGIDQITWVLNKKPDMIFTTIGANDTWTGYVPQTKEHLREIFNALFLGGVKKILWCFYANIGWNDTVQQNPWVNASSGAELRSRFETLLEESIDLASEFNGNVVLVTGGWTDPEINYANHPERYNNGTDPIHLHDGGWSYLAQHCISDFTPAFNSLKAELAGPNLKIGTDTEWLDNPVESEISIGIGAEYLKAPFLRKNRNIMLNT